MRLHRALVLSILGLSAGVAHAADPFAAPAVKTQGRYKGAAIDTTKYRSVQRLTAKERAQFGITEKNVEAVANFQHDGKFWVATIPHERIGKVVYQDEPFFAGIPLGPHSQTRFELTPKGRPVKLIEQTDAAVREERVLHEDISSSLLAIPTVKNPEKFNLLHGALGDYNIRYFMGSLSARANEDLRAKDTIQQTQLKQPGTKNENVAPELRVRALSAAVDMGTQYGVSRLYNTLYQSCTNSFFEMLNRARDKKESSVLARVFQSVLPIPALKTVGMAGPRLPDMSKQFPKGVPTN